VKNLISWREKRAQQLDVPRQHLLRDEVIEKLVMINKSERHFPRKLKAQDVEMIAKILDEEHVDNDVKHYHIMTIEERKSYEEARKIVQKIAAKENLEAQFLISAPDLKRASHDREFFNQKITGWRYQLFGQELENLFYPEQ
jgi:ribonuclease D